MKKSTSSRSLESGLSAPVIRINRAFVGLRNAVDHYLAVCARNGHSGRQVLVRSSAKGSRVHMGVQYKAK